MCEDIFPRVRYGDRKRIVATLNCPRARPARIRNLEAVHLIAVATQNGSRDGTPRKLLVQANRNRFFSVLDRLLSAKPSVEKLTWASEVNSRDRAVVKGQSGPGTKEQELVPSCGMFVKEPEEWEEVGAVPRPMDPHSRFVQSISIRQPGVAVCESGFRRIAIRHDDHSGSANVFR